MPVPSFPGGRAPRRENEESRISRCPRGEESGRDRQCGQGRARAVGKRLVSFLVRSEWSGVRSAIPTLVFLDADVFSSPGIARDALFTDACFVHTLNILDYLVSDGLRTTLFTLAESYPVSEPDGFWRGDRSLRQVGRPRSQGAKQFPFSYRTIHARLIYACVSRPRSRSTVLRASS